MSRALAVLFIALLLAGCSPSSKISTPQPKGHVIGNGGDYLRALFEQGRWHATRVIERLNPTYFTRLPGGSLPAADVSWVLDHRDAIVKDLFAAHHQWDGTLPSALCPFHAKSTCACTQPIGTTEVYFSYNSCAGIDAIPEAAQIVLHETLHHLLFDDEPRVYRITAAIYRTWASNSHAQAVHAIRGMYYPKQVAEHFPLIDDIPLWTGKELAIFNWKQSSISRYDPITNTIKGNIFFDMSPELFVHWDLPNPSNLLEWRYNEHLGDYAGITGVPASGHLILLFSNREEDRYTDVNPPFGMADVDLSTQKLKPLLPGGTTLAADFLKASEAELVSAGNQVFLWGIVKELPDQAPGPYFLGTFYDPSNGKWSDMPAIRLDQLGQFRLVTWVKDYLLIWGNGGTDRDGKPAPRGLMYHLATDRFTVMSEVDAPAPRYAHAIHSSTGSQLLYYGGYNEDYHFLKSGGVFNPVANRWTPMSTEGAPRPGIELSFDDQDFGFIPRHEGFKGVWADRFWIVDGEDLRFYHPPPENRWTVSDRLINPLPIFPSDAFWTGIEVIFWDRKRHSGIIFVP